MHPTSILSQVRSGSYISQYIPTFPNVPSTCPYELSSLNSSAWTPKLAVSQGVGLISLSAWSEQRDQHLYIPVLLGYQAVTALYPGMQQYARAREDKLRHHWGD